MRLLGVLLVHVLSSPVVASTVQIQGVAPRDQGKYAGTDFTCLVDGKAATLPSRRVNDNFCDCDDGDDEPGTAACSHVLSSQFYCANEGFFPETIPTSRIQDGVCDCCDGSDEQLNSKSLCPNTCAHAAEEFRKKAEQRLDVVRRGFETRQAILNGDVATFFEKEEASKATIEKELVALKLLKSRVTVHKDREELREEKYRFEHARREHAESHKDEQTSDQESPHAINENAAEATAFEPLDSITVADDDVDVDRAEDERAAEVLDSYRETVKSQIELLDGTKVSLADYLRMDHRKTPHTVKDMQRNDLVGDGGMESRQKAGLMVLRVIGVILCPLRALVEVVRFSPRTIWSLLSTPTIAGPLIDKLPGYPSLSHSVWFRGLAGGTLYHGYSSLMWGAQVIWDAPVYVYHYLFPTLDTEMKLSTAESFRTALSEIESEIAKLEKEQKEKREAANIDFGPDRAYFALKDRCIAKKIEKYEYKFCAFGDITQDQTKLGKWDGWGLEEDKVDYKTMRYTKGYRCYNGPERSVLVTLECGDKDEIVSVAEPSTCVYEMTIRSPLACTAHVLAQAQEDVALWSRKE